MNLCDIVIPVWNERELTKNCLERIEKYTKYPVRLIVIDNGSDEETSNYLKSKKDNSAVSFILIRNNKNLGFVKAVNQGFAEASSPYICLLNNDTLVCENWLEDMIELFDKNKDIAIINPSSNVLGQCADRDKIDSYAASLKSKKGFYQKMDFCRGFCMLIKKTLIDQVGPFDEIFEKGYFEEADFCKRAQKHGAICVRSKSSYVYHIDRASFGQIDGLTDLFNKNRMIFYKRWGKPIWIAFVIDSVLPDETTIISINTLLDEGHKIIVMHKKGINIKSMPDHINLKLKEISFPFYFTLFYKIIERKKMKKPKVLVAKNKSYDLLENMKFIHNAEIFKNNENAALIEFCRKLSFDNKFIQEKE